MEGKELSETFKKELEKQLDEISTKIDESSIPKNAEPEPTKPETPEPVEENQKEPELQKTEEKKKKAKPKKSKDKKEDEIKDMIVAIRNFFSFDQILEALKQQHQENLNDCTLETLKLVHKYLQKNNEKPDDLA